MAICAIAIVLMMVVGTVDILSGLLLGRFLSYKVELSGTLLAASIFIGSSVVQRRGEHLRVDLFDASTGATLKAFGRMLGLLCGLLVFSAIAWGLWQQAISSTQIREISADTSGFLIWPWKVAAAGGATLTWLVIVGQLGRGFATRFHKADQ